ncbi:MAG: peptidoglycan editing factor PgeF [Pseudomonadota bacterium]
MSAPFENTPLIDSAAHGFFGRDGGVSEGIYASMNSGPGSSDAPDNVQENRRRATKALGAKSLSTANQVHSATALYIDTPIVPPRPTADALVTDQPGLAVGVLTGDCIPALFATNDGTIVAAAHAGWRGSLDGILEATIALMVEHGAAPHKIRCALGPCLRAPAFEVEEDLLATVTNRFSDAERFFEKGPKPNKWVFDHVAFAVERLKQGGVLAQNIAVVGDCTLTHPVRYFSYRKSRQMNHSDYGRNLSAIVINNGS